MLPPSPIVKDLILVGGGHTHALVIKKWAMAPLQGVRLTLVSPNWQTPYSGMLPGLIAGHYTTDDMHIDLRALCSWAKVRFIEDHVNAISRQKKTISLNFHPDLQFDVLSIDIGATPDLKAPGFNKFAIGIKPIDQFYSRYQACVNRCHKAAKVSKKPFRIMIIGGGAGGVEIALAMANSLSVISNVSISLIIRGNNVLTNYPSKIQKAVDQALKAHHIQLISDFDVARLEENKIISTEDKTLFADEIFLCTQVIAANWLANSGLDCDSDGFVSVNQFLQSTNCEGIFAVGDVANMTTSPRPKAGVYAVRQAPLLIENLKRFLLKKDLRPFVPQDNFLSLLSLGPKKAIAARNTLSLTLPALQHWLWRLKDNIDQKFMAQFHQLAPLAMPSEQAIDDRLIDDIEQAHIQHHTIRCAGCGSKVGSSILKRVISTTLGEHHFKPEDAAIISTPETTLLQTVDQITSPLDNPYIFGKIATLHALSDIFAMNGQTKSAQILLNLPFASTKIQTQEITLVMKGVLEILSEHHCQLLGGHTAEAKELSLGLVVNAVPFSNRPLFQKDKLRQGDTLVITKPIGTGVILAAPMHHKTKNNWQYRGDWHKAAVDSMLISNQQASSLFSSLGAEACTDITGFGLAGHLCEMLEASRCKAEITLDAIPVLKGATELTLNGIRSSLYEQNSEVLQELSVPNNVYEHPSFPLLFDPQTSGGLLVGLNTQALTKLQAQDKVAYFVVGKVTNEHTDWDLKISK